MHPAEFRIDAVVVNRQARPRTHRHLGLFVLESGGHLHGGQGAHVPDGDASLDGDSTGNLFFIVAAVDVFDQQTLLLKRR